MGAMGCMVTGGEKKQDKKSPKWVSRTCFVMYGRGEKKQEVGRDGPGDHRGSRGVIEGEQGARCTGTMCLSNEKTINKQGDKRKRLIRTCFCPLGRGNFPRTTCFAKKQKKHTRSTPDGCVWVNMGVRGFIYTGGSKSKTKRGTNVREGRVL